MWPIKLSSLVVVSSNPSSAEEVCKKFRRPGVYLAMIDPPLKRLEKYGVFRRDLTVTINVISQAQPDTVIIAGCETETTTILTQMLTERGISCLTNPDKSVLKNLPGYQRKCNDPEIYRHTDDLPSGKSWLVLEEGNDLQSVIAKNLAIADNAAILLIPPVSQDDLAEFDDILTSWNSSDALPRNESGKKIFARIQAQLGNLPEFDPTNVTFVTLGIPYGLYPMGCPASHLFIFPHLGLSILRGMLKSAKLFMQSPLVVLFDPGECVSTEFNTLRSVFRKNNYVIRNCFGINAKVRNAHFLTQTAPSDFIFYSTHCGELSGKRITESFETEDGSTHTITYEMAAGFAPKPDSDLIAVTMFKRWVSIDDVAWGDVERKKQIQAGRVIERYIDLARSEESREEKIKLLNSEDCARIKGASALKMYDSNFLPILHNVGDSLAPLVFSNACSSWINLAGNFINGGASIYIGTSLDINNAVAVEVASKVSRSIVKGRAVSYALHQAQKTFSKDLGYSPYLMAGYLYTKISPVPSIHKCQTVVASKLRKAIALWKEYISKEGSPDLKKNAEEIVQYLEEELRSLTSVKKVPV